jgi:16S rRNA (adenine1518-N6/adenine1519-N6)-dimethyltransferase
MPARGRGDGGRMPPIRKSLGQHFLDDPRILDRIVDAVEPSTDETLIEIGPGRGSLTARLHGKVGRLILIEYDRALAEALRKRYADDASVTVVQADVLTVNLADVAGGPFKVVGNIPYYITTPILFQALEPPRPRSAVYLVQREVSQRLGASPGTSEYGALSVNAQALARIEVLFRVAPGSFHPPPKVESAVVRVTPLANPVIADDEQPQFRRLVQDAFGFRRKQMRRVVRELLDVDATAADTLLASAEIDPAVRPEVLSPDAFARLARAISRDSSARS